MSTNLSSKHFVLCPVTTAHVDTVRGFLRLDGRAMLAGLDALSERELVESVVARGMASFARRGYGLWIVVARHGREPVGLCSLRTAYGVRVTLELVPAGLAAEVLGEVAPLGARAGLACRGVGEVQLVLPHGQEELRPQLCRQGWTIVDGTRERVVRLRVHDRAPG